jgi:hypothetical protein
MRGYVQCASDGQREFFDLPLRVRESVVFCGCCGDLLAVNPQTVEVA